MSDYIPPSDKDFLEWHDNATAHAKDVGACISAADLAQLEADNADLHSAFSDAALKDTEHKQAVAHKTVVRSRSEGNARPIMRRVKAHAEFTPALSALLRLQGPAYTINLATLKPKLVGLDHTDGEIEITSPKGKTDGIHLYCQREGDTGWVLLGFISAFPYFDRRPLLQPGKPELRRYTAVYVVKNQEVGQFSDEVVINCAP